MDEATSNIDQMTDTLIQKIIKENFQDTTICKNKHNNEDNILRKCIKYMIDLINSNNCASSEDNH